jgi:acyl carrier protein
MGLDLKGELELIFQRLFKDEKIILSDETTASDVSRWDSLSHLELITTIENKFNILFSLEEVISFKNVGALLTCIEKKINE